MAIRKKTDEERSAEGLAPVSDRMSAEAALADGSYEASQEVRAAREKLAQYQQEQPAAYASQYQSRIDGLLDRILNREGFTYNFDADPLYRSYKDQYIHNGRLAMQDTLADAAAATGGYGSSYAAAAGSGAYQNYLDRLNGKIPELYSAALAAYKADGEQMQSALSQLTAREKADRTAYEDTVADYYKGLSAYAAQAQNAYEADYGEYENWRKATQDMRDYYAGQEQQTEKSRQSERAYALALAKYQENIRRWEAEQAASQEKWQAQLAQQQAQFAAEMDYKKEQAMKKTTAAAGGKKTGAGKDKTAGGSTGGAGTQAGGGAGRRKETFEQAVKNGSTKIGGWAGRRK